MNREIKFRQFIDGKFHYWGFLEKGIFTTPKDSKYPSKQFTGLYDKNKKMIWEGDIVRIQNNYKTDEPVDAVTKVFFKDGAFETDFYATLIRIALPGNWIVEVIGNIYENPELLESKNE